jgi:nucleoside 2-deoxyribosyltransferase
MTATKVYFAGRMGLNAENAFKDCYRPFSTTMRELSERPHTAIVRKTFWDLPILYTGPYRTGTGDHGGIHGDADDWTGQESFTLRRSLDGIHECDVFFAYIDDLEAYGTLAEIGYAHALGKRIVLGFQPAVMGEDRAGCPTLRANPMWFAARMADKVIKGPREHVLDEFYFYLAHWQIERDQAALAAKRWSKRALENHLADLS